jgi:hypothetical protein
MIPESLIDYVNKEDFKGPGAAKPLECKNQTSKCKITYQNSKINSKIKEVTNYSNKTNTFSVFGFRGGDIILHFYLSFCFLIFDI